MSNTYKSWLILFRAGNNLGGVIAVFLGAIMALENIPHGTLLYITILQALSVFSFMASWNALNDYFCLLYTSPSPRDATLSRMPSSA